GILAHTGSGGSMTLTASDGKTGKQRISLFAKPLLAEQTSDKTHPFNAVYYSDKAVNLRLRVFLDFLVEELGNNLCG
ncbi:hypothetical protein LN384_25625, partial [Enterobacter hormaechei subsp. steigerwaltii]|nr:hypothetical protein [Enterobacter hormaechei subsp. steigerwaltii]